jgi:predicted GH43/DUF377 family glycosyl hydrolase
MAGAALAALALAALAPFPLSAGLLGGGVVLLAWVGYNLLRAGISVFPYDRILSASSEDGLRWAKDPGVRIDVGGIHESCQVYSPEVAAVEGGYRMYYRAGGYGALIASAYSEDGLSWTEEPGARVEAGAGLLKLGDPEVVRCSPEGWRLYLAGYDGACWRIYCCDSGDGLCWQEPRLCLDLSGRARLNQASNPCVALEGGGWRLHFLGFDQAETALFTAESADGLAWGSIRRCAGHELQGYQVSNICVHRAPGGPLRLYFAEHPVSTVAGSRIVSALSPDGVNWTREEGIRLAPGGREDQYRAFCPDVVHLGGRWRMYYGGLGRHWLSPYTLFSYRRRVQSAAPPAVGQAAEVPEFRPGQPAGQA